MVLVASILLTLIFGHCGVAKEPPKPAYEYTKQEIDLVARVVMSEASTLNFAGKQAVARVIFNRIDSESYPNTLEEVIKGQFSTADNGTPTEECYEAISFALNYPECFPSDMFWFRDSHYHTFAEDYCQIGNMYFSTVNNYYEED